MKLNIGETIKKFRKEREITQEEFAEVSDIKLDTEKIVAQEIEQNANTVDFVESEEPEVVESQVVEPSFMED